jgi:hypothetical protein
MGTVFVGLTKLELLQACSSSKGARPSKMGIAPALGTSKSSSESKQHWISAALQGAGEPVLIGESLKESRIG